MNNEPNVKLFTASSEEDVFIEFVQPIQAQFGFFINEIVPRAVDIDEEMKTMYVKEITKIHEEMIKRFEYKNILSFLNEKKRQFDGRLISVSARENETITITKELQKETIAKIGLASYDRIHFEIHIDFNLYEFKSGFGPLKISLRFFENARKFANICLLEEFVYDNVFTEEGLNMKLNPYYFKLCNDDVTTESGNELKKRKL